MIRLIALRPCLGCASAPSPCADRLVKPHQSEQSGRRGRSYTGKRYGISANAKLLDDRIKLFQTAKLHRQATALPLVIPLNGHLDSKIFLKAVFQSSDIRILARMVTGTILGRKLGCQRLGLPR